MKLTERHERQQRAENRFSYAARGNGNPSRSFVERSGRRPCTGFRFLRCAIISRPADHGNITQAVEQENTIPRRRETTKAPAIAGPRPRAPRRLNIEEVERQSHSAKSSRPTISIRNDLFAPGHVKKAFTMPSNVPARPINFHRRFLHHSESRCARRSGSRPPRNECQQHSKRFCRRDDHPARRGPAGSRHESRNRRRTEILETGPTNPSQPQKGPGTRLRRLDR